jgi:two-component system, sensor histidine kinase and response regulator FitF
MLLSGKRLYIVEDNAINQSILDLILHEQGARTIYDRWGKWGPETIDRIRQSMPVDMVLLDLMLSHHVTGYDIFKGIRKNPEFDAIPIVAVSASNPSEAIPMAQSLGFNGFISKPINAVLFPNQLLEVMNGGSVWYAR